MEWYESLFLQMCGHVISQSRVSTLNCADRSLNLEVTATRDLVASYRRGVALAFTLPEMKMQFVQGVECVMLLLVHEYQFSNVLAELKKTQDVVLSASLRTDIRASDFANYHVDVAIVRRVVSDVMGTSH
ncbi:hypothetical protein [Pseudomonas sp. PS01300]|uniref:hypothetical protein n=1 Tax=Pseudomonas sp. PS01300 TaxID=2991436 RepID=UPI00249AE373|nr:hypothetical protein [Pseudomonas sp. PS01300]